MRRPGEAGVPRMAALARLPVFLALEGKRAVVAGDGPPAAWKAELLSAAGADVDVFGERPCEELRALAAQPPRGAIVLRHRVWRAGDLRGAAVAVGGFDDEEQAQGFAQAAHTAGVPVNVIDRPDYCDFAFGAIVNRSPLVIGISTDGAAPVFAQAIRARLETMIPRGFARWAEAARRWRPTVQRSEPSSAARLRFWQAFARAALAHPEREPASSDVGSLLRAAQADNATGGGRVTLIGAGQRDPELLTLRAVRALQSADVILIDGLVAPDIIDFARREAKKMLVAAAGNDRSRDRDDPCALAVALARAGRHVAWLRGGELAMCRSAGAAIAACRAAGISAEAVPGVDHPSASASA
jgi:uroporphyrin-III C-methyltransferase/precorrin-2 dehydrogenase/sirohydrochlorin ferrochelatase